MQYLSKTKKGVAAVGGAVAAVSATSANAAGTIDLSSITGAVSSTDIVAGVLAIGAVMAVVWATVKAAKIVMAFLKSA